MKRWLWETDNGTWSPIVVCPHCGSAWNPVAIHWFTRCPLCRKRVRPPKKDYWKSMGEGDDKE